MGNAIKRKKKDKLQVDEEAHSGWLNRAAHLGISDEQEAPFEPGKADLSKAKILKVMDVVLSIPDEIREVYEQFYDIVVAPGMDDITHHVEVMLYCNLRAFEQSVSGRSARMLDLLEKFAAVVDPNTTPDLSALNQHIRGDKASIWFRVKNLYLDGTVPGGPGIDVGFTCHAPEVAAVKWIDIHMLMHQCEDIDNVRSYANKESWSLTGFGMSIGQVPEQRYILSPPQYRRNYTLASFLFFRELGFKKPNQGVMEALTNSDPKEMSLQATVAVEGLIRLGVQCWSPRSDTHAWIKAAPACSKLHKPEIPDIMGVSRLFQALPEEFMFFSDKRGFGTSVTWRKYDPRSFDADGLGADGFM
jgi:hypothetical protein